MRAHRDGSRKRRMAVIRQLSLAVERPSTAVSWLQPVPSPNDQQQFAEDCQAVLPLRLVILDERTGQSSDVLLERPFAILGTADTCDVRLPHPDVSRHHAYLQIFEGRLLVSDLGSRTGIHFGGQSRPRGWLLPGGLVQVGPFAVMLALNEFDDEQELRSEPVHGAGGRRSRYVLEFLNAHSRMGGKRQSALRQQVNLLGWNHLCNLRLQHHTVDRVHCSLVVTRGGLWAVDLRSGAGTEVNGERVEFSRLEEGDRIGIGRFQLVVALREASSDSVVVSASAAQGGAASGARTADSMGDGEVFVSDAAGAESRDAGANLPAAPKTVSAGLLPMPPMPSFAGGLMPPVPPGGNLSDGMAMAMMQQFALMQQQLFEHTQHLLTSVVQAFHSAHNSQLDLIREELGRLHELNRELQELNARKAQAGAAQPPGPAAQGAASPAAGGAPPGSEAGPAATRRPMPRSAHPVPASAAVAPGPAGADDELGGADVHGWLNSRIHQLEKERTSRWQRIMQMISSGGA